MIHDALLSGLYGTGKPIHLPMPQGWERGVRDLYISQDHNGPNHFAVPVAAAVMMC